MLDITIGEKRYKARGMSLFNVVLDPTSPPDVPVYKAFFNCRYNSIITSLTEEDGELVVNTE